MSLAPSTGTVCMLRHAWLFMWFLAIKLSSYNTASTFLMKLFSQLFLLPFYNSYLLKYPIIIYKHFKVLRFPSTFIQAIYLDNLVVAFC